MTCHGDAMSSAANRTFQNIHACRFCCLVSCICLLTPTVASGSDGSLVIYIYMSYRYACWTVYATKEDVSVRTVHTWLLNPIRSYCYCLYHQCKHNYRRISAWEWHGSREYLSTRTCVIFPASMPLPMHLSVGNYVCIGDNNTDRVYPPFLQCKQNIITDG